MKKIHRNCSSYARGSWIKRNRRTAVVGPNLQQHSLFPFSVQRRNDYNRMNTLNNDAQNLKTSQLLFNMLSGRLNRRHLLKKKNGLVRRYYVNQQSRLNCKMYVYKSRRKPGFSLNLILRSKP